MKSRFKVLGLMSAVLLIFAMGSVASADNAASINIAISYPCTAGQNPCDTGVAVSRAVGGDVVNVYITLLDAAGNPATAGPNGEALTGLTGRLTSQLAVTDSITANRFLLEDANVSFAGKASARAYVDYTGAMAGVDPLNVDITGANFLTARADVTVVAPPAVSLTTRTCASVDYDLYDAIGPDCANGGQSAVAGASIAVQVIADAGSGLFTTAPNLEGKQITVKAYADYIPNQMADYDDPNEAAPVASGTFTMSNGIAQGNLVINSAGPAGLDVVFIADATDIDEAGTDIGTLDLDLVNMIPGAPAAIVVVGQDDYDGNLIVPAANNCVTVLDDACAPPKNIQVAVVDALGNAVNATATVAGTLDGILAEQLSGCDTINIAGTYSGTCQLADINAAGAGSIVIGPLPFTATGLTGTSVSVYLLPASECELDMQVSVPAAAIAAGDTVTLSISSIGAIPVVTEGDDLVISAGGLLLSSDGFASATSTLQINNVLDADDDAAGIQVPIQIYGASEDVCITVQDLDKCGAEDTTDTCIASITAGAATNLAVVGVADGAETESVLDETGSYVGTSPIVIDSYIQTNSQDSLQPPVWTTILDGEAACDLQVWDAFTNVVDDTPADIVCSTDSPYTTIEVDGCDVSVSVAWGGAGTTATVTCGVDIDEDPELDLTRTFRLTSIVNAIPDDPEEPSTAATALTVIKEGPQAQDGTQINPLPGGEAIIKVLPNGVLGASANVQIAFGAGSVAGAELRNLDGTVVILPVTITLTQATPTKRYVVYAPAAGQVVVNVSEVSATGLAAGTGTVVFGAACEVAVTPASPTVGQGGTLQLAAATTCEGAPTAGTYTWEVMESTCTSSGTINETGLYAAPAVGGCTETVRVTDTANGGVTADVIINVNVCTAEVQISGNTNLIVGASQAYTAATTCGSAPLTGTYSWELDGAAVGTGNSYTFNATAAGTKTLKVTDTTNNVTDTVTITVVTGCGINVVQDRVLRSRWIPLITMITIVGDDTDITFATRVNYESANSPLSVIKLGKLVFKNVQTIQQTVLIMPSLLTGVKETETIEVTLTNGGCETASDTFDIELLPFILDK